MMNKFLKISQTNSGPLLRKLQINKRKVYGSALPPIKRKKPIWRKAPDTVRTTKSNAKRALIALFIRKASF
jgi:hypothetical protein